MNMTFADYTPDERANMRGMWCEAGGKLWVVRSVYEAIGGIHCRLINPATGTMTHFTPDNLVTLRPDLPRAWNADGTPVEMDREDDVVRPHPRGGMIGTFENPTYTDLAPGTRVRRFVAEWEVAE